MSAPDSNIEKQKRWHRGPLIGMALVAIFGVAMIFFWLMHEAAAPNKTSPVPEAVGTAVPTTDAGKPATTAP